MLKKQIKSMRCRVTVNRLKYKLKKKKNVLIIYECFYLDDTESRIDVVSTCRDIEYMQVGIRLKSVPTWKDLKKKKKLVHFVVLKSETFFILSIVLFSINRRCTTCTIMSYVGTTIVKKI